VPGHLVRPFVQHRFGWSPNIRKSGRPAGCVGCETGWMKMVGLFLRHLDRVHTPISSIVDLFFFLVGLNAQEKRIKKKKKENLFLK
jgi:hypothetical protein